MALTDINFQPAEQQNFIIEIPTGILNAPVDIMFEPSSTQYLVMELTILSAGGGNIFIMSE